MLRDRRASVAAVALAVCLCGAGLSSTERSHEQPFQDVADDLVLSATSTDLVYAWQLDYARAARMVKEFLAEGHPTLALEAAKAEFVLSPPDPALMDAAVAAVREALSAADGNGLRAEAFGKYAQWGAAGPDGASGTADDCTNPLPAVACTVLKKDPQYYRELDAALDLRAMRCAYFREIVWFEVEKAYARLNGGEFDEALRMLLTAKFRLEAGLRGIDKEDATEMGNISDDSKRISYGIAAVYRARTSTVAGVEKYVQEWNEFLRYGPPGRDGKFGTGDDLLPPGVAGSWTARAATIPPEFAAALAAAAGDHARERIAARLDAIRDAYARVAWKLSLLAEGGRNPWAQLVAEVAPSPYDLFWDLRKQYTASKPSLAGLPADDVRRLTLCIDDASAASLECLLQLYLAPSHTRPDTPSARVSRAFLSAYILGTCDESFGPRAVSILSRNLSRGEAPVFIVDDALAELNDIGAAVAAVDLLDAANLPGWRDGRRHRRLGEMAQLALKRGDRDMAEAAYERVVRSESPDLAEAAQYSIIDLYGARARRLMASADLARMAQGRSVYLRAASACSRFVELYPQSPRLLKVKYLAALYRYYGADYLKSLEDTDAFLAENPDPAYLPNVLLVAGLCHVELNDTDKAVSVLAKILDEYPKSPVASHAALSLATSCIRSARYEDAKASLHRVIDYYPDTAAAASARLMLESVENMKDSNGPAATKASATGSRVPKVEGR